MKRADSITFFEDGTYTQALRGRVTGQGCYRISEDTLLLAEECPKEGGGAGYLLKFDFEHGRLKLVSDGGRLECREKCWPGE